MRWAPVITANVWPTTVQNLDSGQNAAIYLTRDEIWQLCGFIAIHQGREKEFPGISTQPPCHNGHSGLHDNVQTVAFEYNHDGEWCGAGNGVCNLRSLR